MERSYIVEIDGQEWQIQIDEDADGTTHVRVGDEPAQPMDFVLAQLPARYSLLAGGQSRQLRVVPSTEEPGAWDVMVDHLHLTARVQTERERRLSRVASSRHAAGGELAVKAPMPGLVRAVVVAVGEPVQVGQRLVVLEAMKMENDIQAPRAGTVKAVQVVAGDKVEHGRVLVVLE